MMLSKNEKIIILFSLCLFASGVLSLNIYLPSLLHLSQVFHTNINNVKMSISLFLFSYAASQFIWGSLSEKLGRKKTVLLGLYIAIVGTILILLTSNIFLFNVGRIIEGFGIGCASVLSRTILVDSLDRTKIAIAMSYLATTNNILPALAPIIGGQLYYWLGWHAIFIFLLIYTAFLIFIFTRKFSETHNNIQKNLNFNSMLFQYISVLSNKVFWGYSLPALILSGGLVGYYASTPFIFISVLHFSAKNYAYFSIAPVSFFILGTTASRYVFSRIGFNKTILSGLLIAIFSGILAIINYFIFTNTSVITILIPITIYALATGFISPCCNAGAMATMHHLGGATGAVLGAGFYVFWAIFSLISTHLSFKSLGPASLYISVSASVSLIVYWWLTCYKTKVNKADYRVNPLH